MHVLWRYNREVCENRTCLWCQLAGKRPPQLWRYTGLLEKMLRHVDVFISPSRFTKRKHLELGLNIPIVHIPYFLPQPESSGADKKPDGEPLADKPYFLFVGRLEKIKGLQNVIPVFLKHVEYDLLIAGDGEYREVLKKAAGDAGNIKFLGRLNHDRLQKLYARAVAVIVPSICVEVFGIIIIEAFSMKTPVIVNDLGAMPEVIEDSGGGFVYKKEEDLVAAMKKLAESPELRNELGLKGYKAYLKYWSEDSHIQEYLNLIETMREKKFGPGREGYL
jgi:glycosyltransferase involved in cell wall biosynthesis